LYAEEFVRMLTDRGVPDDTRRLSIDPEDLSFPSSVQAIIAARLDTLSVDRKAVLQDAAVIGKVFWAGAVAALGGRSEDEVAHDLHELAKKELVRPSRASAVVGQLECSFWHAFIRDVAYGEIPRATRATKHAAAARWIEKTAGDRVEEYAEILAHHYLTAAELAEATAAPDVKQLRTHARHHLLTASRRAVNVDVPRAESLARSAFEITPPDDVDRPHVETTLADALRSAGRSEEARRHLEDAVAGAESRGDLVQRAQAMLLLARLAELDDPPEADRIVSEVIDALKQLPPGPELVNALREAAGRALVRSRYADVSLLADQTLELLDEGVQVDGPRDLIRAVMLHFRGISRFNSGDLGGQGDVRVALALNPNDPVIHNNLATTLAATEGFGPAITEVQEGIRLATAKGATAIVCQCRETLLDFYFSIGRWDELIELAPSLIDQLSDIGDVYDQTLVAISLARPLLLRGADASAELVARSLPRARSIADPQVLLPALVVAGSAAAHEGARDELASLLVEIESALDGDREGLHPWLVPEIVRLAVWSQDLRLGERVSRSGSTYPAGRASSASALAAICEAKGKLDQAISRYAEAVQRWSELGHVVERAYALFGLGRSRLRTGDAQGTQDALAARRIFDDLHAQPLVAEVDRLLAERQRMSS
jgi:tetratricopeptide (TPR) repeat protein